MLYLWHEGFLRLLPFLLQHLHLREDAVSRGLKLPLLRLDLLHLVHQLIDLVIDACTGVKGSTFVRRYVCTYVCMHASAL